MTNTIHRPIAPISLHLASLVLAASLAGCGGGGGGGDGGGANSTPPTPTGEASASGTLQLSGADTAFFGTELNVGDIALVLGPGTVQTYLFVDEFTTISGFEYGAGQTLVNLFQNTTINDPQNGITVNVIDDAANSGVLAISMVIRVQGVDYDYTCTMCQGLTVDPINRMIDFDQVVVMPQGAATGPLTLDGTIGWVEG